MRSIGILVIVLVKAAILFMYANFQNTLLKDIDGAYRFLFYLIACGGFLLVVGLTWRKANITELHWWSHWAIIPIIIIIPPALVALYFLPASVEGFMRPFQDVAGLVAFFVSELFVVAVVYGILKLAIRRRIQIP